MIRVSPLIHCDLSPRTESASGPHRCSMIPIHLVSTVPLRFDTTSLDWASDAPYMLFQPTEGSVLFAEQQSLLSQHKQQQDDLQKRQTEERNELLRKQGEMPTLRRCVSPLQWSESPLQSLGKRMPQLPLAPYTLALQKLQRSTFQREQCCGLDMNQLLAWQQLERTQLQELNELERNQQYRVCPKLQPVQLQQILQIKKMFEQQCSQMNARHLLQRAHLPPTVQPQEYHALLVRQLTEVRHLADVQSRTDAQLSAWQQAQRHNHIREPDLTSQ